MTFSSRCQLSNNWRSCSIAPDAFSDNVVAKRRNQRSGDNKMPTATYFRSTTQFVLAGLWITACLNPALGQDTEQQILGNNDQASSVTEEIVVTARRREESLKDAPMSVQAFQADMLAENQIDNVEDLIGRVPNLSLSSNPLSPGKDFLNLVVRGVGAQSAGTPAVGTFVDGVYVPALSFDIAFMDVERVELLRGPQGTLFGRNTEGGALNIVLRRPDETRRAKLAFTYDEFETARTQAAFSGPLSDNLFGSIALDHANSDGYLKNFDVAVAAGAGTRSPVVSANDDRRTAARMALRYIASDQLEFNLAVDGSRRTGLDGYPGVPRGINDYVVRSEFQVDGEYDNFGGALTVGYEFGDGTKLTAVTGYRSTQSILPFDFDGSPERTGNYHDLRTDQDIFSQELSLAGQWGENLDWFVGVYGFSENHVQDRIYQLPDVDAFPAGIFIDAQIQSLDRKGVAVFADVAWHPTPKLELGAGLRYSDESVDSDVTLDFTLPGIITIVDSGTDSVSDSEISPTATLRYSFTPSLTSYARYARGYRAGGFPLAPASASTNISFGAEVSDNYEVGLKGYLFDNKVSFDFAAFRIDISDQQLSTIVFLNDDPNLPVASVGNAGESRSEGFEANISLTATENLLLSANFGKTDATYTDYIDTVGADRSGERFPFVPEEMAQISASYTIPAGNLGDFELFAGYRYVGDILSGSGVDVDIQFDVDSYDIIDLRASLIRDNWRIDAFIDNVSDEFIETRVFNAFFYAEPRPFSIVLPPRRAGLRFTYEF